MWRVWPHGLFQLGFPFSSCILGPETLYGPATSPRLSLEFHLLAPFLLLASSYRKPSLFQSLAETPSPLESLLVSSFLSQAGNDPPVLWTPAECSCDLCQSVSWFIIVCALVRTVDCPWQKIHSNQLMYRGNGLAPVKVEGVTKLRQSLNIVLAESGFLSLSDLDSSVAA